MVTIQTSDTMEPLKHWDFFFSFLKVANSAYRKCVLYSDRHFFFLNETISYICGFNGIILKSTDGGNTWSTLNSGVTSTLYSIHFVSPLIGFAVGDNSTIIKTTDGGQTWTPSTSSEITSSYLHSVFFTSETIGEIGETW